MSHFEVFKKKIIELSNSDNYDDALLEWVYMGESFYKINNCLCGHKITDNRVVYHKETKQKIIVGNCCINKFGIERRPFNKSKLAYVEFAIQKNENRILDAWLRQALYPKIEHGGRFKQEELDRLERITGEKSRFKAVDAKKSGLFDF